MRTHSCLFTLMVVFSAAVSAQESNPANQPQGTGWRRFGENSATDAGPQSMPLTMPATAPAGPLTLPAGTWITVRVNQPLSSDRNQSGDTFSATLIQPLVANGRVIARRGQTVGGGVVEAQKAGHIKGTSRLGLELSELSLADGRQMPIQTKMIERQGNTSVGRDAEAIGMTTGVGAAIGAAADGGFGAGMGAIAGAAVSTIGVLATRGRATVVYPETVLTFRLETPITVDSSLEAFQPVTQQDYEQHAAMRQGPPPQMRRPAYGYPGYPPYYYGPSVYFYSGPRFYYGRGYRRW